MNARALFKRALGARAVSLCFLIMAGTFVASTIYSRALASRFDEYAHSIAYNGVPGVVDLGEVTDDLRQITARAMRARPESLEQDRAAIAGWLAHIDAALTDYERTEDYPGEHALDIAAERKRGPFVDSLERVLGSVVGPNEAHALAVEHMVADADKLAAAVRELIRFNAEHVTRESLAITEERRVASWWMQGLRALGLIVATLGMVLALRAQREQVALVETSKRMAEERASELELFAGRVAHDLRAPLTVIAVRSSIAGQTTQVEVLKSALQKIQRQGERMADIIDALLTFARAGAHPDAGRCDDAGREVDSVIADAQPFAQASKVELVVLPVGRSQVACAPAVLAIVLSNLVRNAIKYIGAGRAGVRRVTVRGRVVGRVLRIEVEDTGPGLPAGSEHAVFEPFVRASREVRDGIGLGLATVKRLVEAHGGAVGVQSDPERGCCFWFELPTGPSSSRDERADPSDRGLGSTAQGGKSGPRASL